MKKLGIIFFMFICSWKMLLAQEYQFYLRPDNVQKRLTAEVNPLKNVQSTYCASSQKQLVNPTNIVGRYEIEGVLMDSIGGNWNFTPNVAGTYQICYYPTAGVTTGGECKTVTVFPALDVSFVLSDSGDSLCLGQSRTINLQKVIGTGTGNLVSFQWNTGQTSSQITIDQPKNYKGKAFDENGCSDSITYFNKIYTNKAFLGNDVVLCKGDSVTFSVASSFLNYTWTNLTTSSIVSTANSLKVKTAGQYELIVVDNHCISKDTINVSVDNIQVKLSSPKDSVCYGQQVSLTATPSNFPSGTLTYLWEYKAKNAPKKLIGTTADNIKSITTPVDSLGNVNLYYVTIKDVNNCTYKDSLLIFKNDSLKANIIPDKVYICGDETVVNLVQAEASKGTAPYTYNWTASNTTLVRLANEDSLKVGVLSKTPIPSQVLLTFKVIDKLGCTATDTVTAKLELFKYKIVKQHQIICPGMTDSLYAEILTPGSGDYTYLWFGNNLPTNNLPYVLVSPTQPKYHEYNLSIFDNQRKCQARAYTDSILVKEIIADIDFGKDTVISCFEGVNINTSISSTGAVPYTKGVPYHYQWNILNGSGNFTNGSQFTQNTKIINGAFGEYTHVSLNIIDSLGCTDSDSVHIFWNPIIKHNAPDTSYICKGNSQQMNVTLSGGTGNLSIQWKKIKGAVTITNTTSTNPTFSYSSTISQDTSLVTLTIKDANQCEKIDTITIINTDFKINPLVKDAKVCPSLPIQLDVEVLLGGSKKYTYKWTTTNGTISNDTIRNPLVTTNQTATYTITMTDLVTKCVASKSFQIPFTAIVPIITNISNGTSLAKDTTVVCFGDELKLNANLSKGGIPFTSGNEYLYTWNVIGAGIGTDATKPNFTIKGGTGATYTTIQLTIEDSQGCKSSKSTVAYWNKLVKPYVDTTYICTPNKGILSLDSSQGLQPFKTYLWKEVKTPTKLVIENPLQATSFVQGLDNDTVQVSLTVTDSANCVGSTITTVIGVNFQIELLAQNDSICPKFNNQLTANVTNDGKGKYQYTWSPNTAINNTTSKQVIVNPTNTTTYSVVVKDTITTCQATASKEVKVIDLQAVISGTIDTLISCIENGKELTLDAKLSKGGSPAYTYTWTSSSNAITVIDGNKQVVKLVDTGLNRPITTQVKLSIQDKLGCTSQDSLAIFWNSPLTVSYLSIVNDTAYICGNDTKEIVPTIIGGTGKYTYKWSVISGNIQLQNNTNSFTQLLKYPANATKQTSQLVFQVQDDLGCVVIDTIVVKSNDLKVGTSVVDDIICPNAQTQIKINYLIQGSGSYSYEWTPNVAIQNNNNTVENPFVNPNKTTTYFVTVKDKKTLCTAKTSATVIVYDLTAVISHNGIPLNDTAVICLGDVYDLDATKSTGGTPFTTGTPYLYDWKKIGSGLLNGSNTQKVSTEQGNPKDYTKYVLTIADKNSCQNRDTVTVYWNDFIKPYIHDTLFVCSPNKGIMTVDSIKGGLIPYSYKWTEIGQLNKLLIENAINDTAFVTIPSNETAKVLLTITDKFACKGFDTTVVKSLDFQVEVIAQFNNVCPKVENELTATILNDGKGKYSYKWTPATSINDVTLKQVIVKPLKTTTYSVLVTDSITGCQATASKEVQVIDLEAQISSTKDTLVSCLENGSTVSLDAKASKGGSPTYTYTWTSSSNQITIVDANKETVQLVDNGLTRPITTQIKLAIQDQLGCVSEDSVSIYWNTPVTVSYPTIVADTAFVCGTESKEITPTIVGGTGKYTYKWTKISGNVQLQNSLTDLTQKVNYVGSVKEVSMLTFEVIDSLGCSVLDTIFVKPSSTLLVGLSSIDDIVCPNVPTQINLTFLKAGSGSYSYNWTPTATLNNSKIQNPIASPNKTTTYNVIVTDNKTFCTAQSSATIVVVDLTAVISHNGVTITDTAIICQGDVFALEATNSNGGTPFTTGTPYLYDWKKIGTGLLNGSNTQKVSTEQGTAKEYTQYILTIADQNACKNSDTVTVYWNESIEPKVDTTFICSPNKGLLTVASVKGGSSPYTYQWNPALGETKLVFEKQNDSTFVSIAAKEIGKAVVTVTDKAGCKGTATSTVVGVQLETIITAQYDTICPTLENILTANVVGGKGSYSYAWSPNKFISDTSLKTVTVKVPLEEVYTVVVKDKVLGCQGQATKKVNVLDIQAIAGNILGGDTVLSCVDTLLLSAEKTQGGTGKYTYSWTSTQANQTLVNDDKKVVSVLDKGLVRPTVSLIHLTVTDNLGCTGSDSVYVNWNPAVKTEIDNQLYACLNVQDTLSSTTTGGTGAYNYQWKLVQGDVTFLGNGEQGTIDEPKLVFKGYNAPTKATFQLIVTDAKKCQSIDTMTVQIQTIQNPSLTVTSDTVCTGTTILGTANGTSSVNPTLSYNWNGKDFVLNDKTYSAKITTDTTLLVVMKDDVTGCKVEVSQDVKVRNIQAIAGNIVGGDTLYSCLDSINVSQKTTGGTGKYTYSWTSLQANQTLVNADKSVVTVLDKGLTRPITSLIQLNIEDDLGCKGKDSVYVTWNSILKTKIEDDFYACLNVKDTLSSITTGGTGTINYQWKVISGDILLGLTTNNEVEFEGVTYENNSIIELTVTDEKMCQATDTVKIQTQAIKNPSLVLSSNTICEGTTVTGTANGTSSVNPTLSYNWNGKDFISSNTFSVKISTDTTLLVVIKDDVTGCKAQATESVKIKNIEVIAGNILGGDTLYSCLDSINVTQQVIGGSGNYTYSWTSLQANQTLVNADKSVVTVVDKGLIRPITSLIQLNIEDDLGCKGKDSVYVHWNPTLTTKIEDDFYACLNVKDTLSSVTTGGTGTINYQWKVISGDIQLGSVTTNNEVEFEGVTYENNSIIELTVTDEKMCQAIDTLKIQTQELKNVSLVVNSTVVCEGTTIVGTADATSSVNPTLSYNWNGKDFISSNTFSVKVSTDTTLLVVIKDDITGCKVQATESVKIKNIEVFAGNIIGADTMFVCNDSTSLMGDVVKGGSGNYTYLWTSSQVNQTLVNADTKTVSVLDKGLVRPITSLVYFNVSDDLGCKGKDSVYVTWNPILKTQIEDDFYACLNVKDTLSSVTTGGTGTINYQWKVISGDIQLGSVTTNNEVEFEGVTYENNSIIELTVTDEKMCQATDTVKIQTQAINNPSLTVNSDTVCTGITVIGTANGTSSVNPTLSYNWNGKDFISTNTFSAKVSTDTTLLVVIKDDVTGCKAQVNKDIKIKNLKVSINTSNPKILCFEEDVTLTAVTTGGAGTNEYQWLENLTTDLNKNAAQITLQPLEKGFDTGTYYKLLVKDATGCSAKDSIQLFRNNQIFADAGRDTSLCLRSSLVLGGKQYTGLKNGVSTDLLYDWKTAQVGATFDDNQEKNPTMTISVATNFVVELTVTDEKVQHCHAKAIAKVQGRTLPKISILNSDSIAYCEKDSIELVPSGIPYPKGTHLTWTSPSKKTSNKETFMAKEEGTYSLAAIDTFACQNKVFVFVNEIPLPKISIAPLVGLLCTNEKIDLTAFVTPALDATEGVGEFTWKVVQGTGTVEDVTSLKTFYNPIITEDAINIQATYQNVCGTVTEAMNSTLSLAPDVKATISETEVNIGDPVEYKIISGTKPYYTYTWGFEGTTVDTLRAVGPYELTYKEEGTYKTSVTVKNSNNNCTASDEFSVKVNTINSFYIPSVFSLSSKNAVNASWRIFGKNISTTEFSVMIYNRWGELVYQTNDLDFMMNTGWNGTDQDNGKEQALGVYTYVIKGKFANNKVFEKIGTVTIVQ